MSFRKGLPGTDKLYLIAFKCHVPRNSEESEEHRSLNREHKNYPIAEYLQNAHGPGCVVGTEGVQAAHRRLSPAGGQAGVGTTEKVALTNCIRSLVPTELEIRCRGLKQKGATIKGANLLIDATVWKENNSNLFLRGDT